MKPLPSTPIDNDAQTVRVRAAEPSTTPLPKAISPFDGKTVRLRPIDLPGVGKVANTVRQRYAALSSLDVRPPSRWEIARVMLVLLLASMPILGISVDVFGLVSHSTTSVAVIVLCTALGAIITFAPPLLESAPVKQAIASARKATRSGIDHDGASRGSSMSSARTHGVPGCPVNVLHMSSHLEVWKPSGRELIPLTGQRVTLGKASTNAVAFEHDETVSRLHAVFENLGFAWSIRDLGSRNGTYLNGEPIVAERVLRSGDEVRVGKSRLIFWEVKDTGDQARDEETKSAQPLELPPRLTPREFDVLVVLCRPLVSDDRFPEPVSVRQMASELFVTEAAVKQHLLNLYDKFSIPTEGDRRVRLANEALRRGAVTIAQLRGSGEREK